MLKMNIMVLICLFLVGCSNTEYIYIKPKPYGFIETPQPKVRVIRVHKDDLKLYKSYINHFRDLLEFHNTQIQDYNTSHTL